MGDCTYCGKSAGFLRRQHRECFQHHEEGKRQILELISTMAFSSSPLDSLQDQVKHIAEESYIRDMEQRALAVEGLSSAIDRSLHENVLSEAEETRLLAVKDTLSLSREDLEKNGTWMKIVKSAVIRDLLNGALPKRFTLTGSIPVNFQKNEQIVWLFNHVQYLEDRTLRQYVGGTQGVSVRVMKGVYYRAGGFKGYPINHTERIHVDTGMLAVTNKNLYFAGPVKTFRIAYPKVVSFQPFNNGIGVVRDAASAKPQFFITNDGWFTYNLITNVAHL